MLIRRTLYSVVCTAVLVSAATAAEPVTKKQPIKPPKPVVAALCSGEPIYAGQVTETLRQLLGGRGVVPALAPRAEATMLEQLIDRRLVLSFLKRNKLTASGYEVKSAIKATEAVLKQQNLTIKERLASLGVTGKAYRTEVLWQLSWAKYLDKRLTDEALAKFFAQNRRDFDGTQLRASHILWARKKAGDQQEIDALTAKAKAVRAEITAGTTGFAEAAKRHSDSPTRDQGGDLGFISRHGEMVEPFSAAAFALEKGQISQPVVTKFGVHLIKCTDVTPGKKSAGDVRPELRSAAIKYVFRRLADAERVRAGVTVEYTGAVPHFKPGTKEIVLPEGYKPSPTGEKKSK